MEHKENSSDFDALIDDDGKILVPSELRHRFIGKKLHVRLLKEEVAAELREHNVTDDEIERISSVQRESREQVVKFLMSEGVLQHDAAFAKRANR